MARRPRLLTNVGLGYRRGGLPASEFADEDAMLQAYPYADSNKLRQLGAVEMLDYLPGQWTSEDVSDTDNLIAFSAANGETSVTTSKNETVRSPKPEVVLSKLAINGGTFHPNLTTQSDWDGKFVEYDDESLLWDGLDAGVRATLFDRWAEFSATPPSGYTQADRDADTLAYDCAVEGITAIFDHLHTQLPGSMWSWHRVPVRAQTTNAVDFRMDLDYGQLGAAARWRGVGSSDENKANQYADFWLDCAEKVYSPLASVFGWFSPRIYIDLRMRNWDQEVPGQSPPQSWDNTVNAGYFRESWMKMWSDQVDLCRRIAPATPLYPAVCPYHPVPGAVLTNYANSMDWYKVLSIDLETHREQARRISDRIDGVSIWSGEDYTGRVAFSVGRPQADPGNAPANGDIYDDANNYDVNDPAFADGPIVRARARIQRRFGISTDLPPHPDNQADEDAWRDADRWAEYNEMVVQHMNAMASSSVLLGSARASTLAALGGATPSTP